MAPSFDTRFRVRIKRLSDVVKLVNFLEVTQDVSVRRFHTHIIGTPPHALSQPSAIFLTLSDASRGKIEKKMPQK